MRRSRGRPVGRSRRDRSADGRAHDRQLGRRDQRRAGIRRARLRHARRRHRRVRSRCSPRSRRRSAARRSSRAWSASGRRWTRRRRPRRCLRPPLRLLGRPIVPRARGRRQRREPLRGDDPAHDRRARPARGRGAHARGVRASAVAERAHRGRSWRLRRLPSFLHDRRASRSDRGSPRPQTARRSSARASSLLAGIVLLMWLVEAINSLDSNRLDQRRHLRPQRLPVLGDPHLAVHPRELPAPDRQHRAVRLPGRDHRAARSSAAAAGDRLHHRSSAGSAPG